MPLVYNPSPFPSLNIQCLLPVLSSSDRPLLPTHPLTSTSRPPAPSPPPSPPTPRPRTTAPPSTSPQTTAPSQNAAVRGAPTPSTTTPIVSAAARTSIHAPSPLPPSPSSSPSAKHTPTTTTTDSARPPSHTTSPRSSPTSPQSRKRATAPHTPPSTPQIPTSTSRSDPSRSPTPPYQYPGRTPPSPVRHRTAGTPHTSPIPSPPGAIPDCPPPPPAPASLLLRTPLPPSPPARTRSRTTPHRRDPGYDVASALAHANPKCAPGLIPPPTPWPHPPRPAPRDGPPAVSVVAACVSAVAYPARRRALRHPPSNTTSAVSAGSDSLTPMTHPLVLQDLSLLAFALLLHLYPVSPSPTQLFHHTPTFFLFISLAWVLIPPPLVSSIPPCMRCRLRLPNQPARRRYPPPPPPVHCTLHMTAPSSQ